MRTQPAARPPMLLQCPTPHYAPSACAVTVIWWGAHVSERQSTTLRSLHGLRTKGRDYSASWVGR
jgi:hypothetical protein